MTVRTYPERIYRDILPHTDNIFDLGSANNAFQFGLGENSTADSTQFFDSVHILKAGDVRILKDNIPLTFGIGQDADIFWNGTNLIIDATLISTGRVLIKDGLQRDAMKMVQMSYT